MIYSGKQIRITKNDGKLVIFRGSAYTLSVEQFTDYGWATVFDEKGNQIWTCSSSEIKQVIEDGFGRENLK